MASEGEATWQGTRSAAAHAAGVAKTMAVARRAAC